MRDFDKARRERSERTREDRTFVLGGETFTISDGVHPSVLSQFEDMSEEDGATKTLEIVDGFIRSILEGDDAGERWDRVRERRGAGVVTIEDLMELSQWAIETLTGRPTLPPSVSSDGPATTEIPSTAGSFSLVGTVE